MMEPYVETIGPTNDVTKDFLPVKKRSHVHTYLQIKVFLTGCKSTLLCHNKAQQMMSHQTYFQLTVFPPPSVYFALSFSLPSILSHAAKDMMSREFSSS